MKLLIIDDEPSIVETLRDIFHQRGFSNIWTAVDGRVGLDLAKKETPDMIVIDINMPKMPGSEAVAQLRKDASTKNIPVIFISGMVERDQEGQQSVNINGVWYPAISKPFNPRLLIERINEYTKAQG